MSAGGRLSVCTRDISTFRVTSEPYTARALGQGVQPGFVLGAGKPWGYLAAGGAPGCHGRTHS